MKNQLKNYLSILFFYLSIFIFCLISFNVKAEIEPFVEVSLGYSPLGISVADEDFDCSIPGEFGLGVDFIKKAKLLPDTIGMYHTSCADQGFPFNKKRDSTIPVWFKATWRFGGAR